MKKEILLITTHNCPKCKEATKKLDAAGVDYMLMEAEENIELVEKLKISEAPTLVVCPENEYDKYTKIYSGLGGVHTFLKGGAK